MDETRHRDVLRFIAHYARRHAWTLAMIITLSVCSTAFFLLQPFFYRAAIEAIVGSPAPDAATFRFAILKFLEGLAMAAAAITIEQLGGILLGRVETRMMRLVYTDVFSTVQRHSMGFHVNEFAGSTARKIGRGVDSVEGIMDRIIMNFLPTLILMLGFMVVLSFLAPPLSFVILAGIVVYALLSFVLNIYVARLYRWSDSQDTLVTGNLVDAITANPLVKSFAAENREDVRHESLVAEWERRQRITWIASTAITVAQFLFLILIELAVYMVAVWLWYRGRFEAGAFIILIFYIGQLWGRLWDLGRNIRDYIRAVAHGTEMVDIAERPLAVQDEPGAEVLTVARGEVSFNHVRFQYEKASHPIFQDFSARISPGERVALVGHSGGGKSTFVKLLLRLYDLQGGDIEIDGQDISQVTQESLRSAIALVPQEPILFHRTIAENIAYGKPGASIDEIDQAAKSAHAHEFISVLPKKYETLVGERGVKLSGGERQRVAIARALLADRPILVLDEATSSLDSLSERYIQEALVTLMRNRTSIIIAHRLSTIKKADRILVIEQGSITEEGTHETLLQKEGGTYRHLYELQAGGFIGE